MTRTALLVIALVACGPGTRPSSEQADTTPEADQATAPLDVVEARGTADISPPSSEVTPDDTAASDVAETDAASEDSAAVELPPTEPEDGGVAGAADVDPGLLNGALPDAPLALAEFEATNADGAARTRDDVLGKPTVMWFFPFSGTPG